MGRGFLAPVFAHFLFAAGGIAAAEEAQAPPAPIPQEQAPEPSGDEILITATLLEDDPFEIPASASLVPSLGGDSPRSPRTVGEAFHDLPAVLPQKTAPGQFSPFLRGFTGFRTLLLIDGIRLNNAVFREGPNQYASFIDPLLVERSEIAFGPSSVLYGSDAVGGVLQFFTRGAEPGAERATGGRVVQRYAGADDSSVTRLEGYLSGHRVALFAGGSWRDFGTQSGGRHASEFPNTAYTEWSNDAKARIDLGSDWMFTADYQRHVQHDVPRTHATTAAVSYRGTAAGTDLRRDLSGVRELGYLRLAHAPADERSGSVTFYRALITEREERIASNLRYSRQGFVDGVHGVNGHYSWASPLGKITAGAEYSWEDIDSDFVQFNANGTLNSVRTRGPVSDQSFYQQAGVFAQNEIEVTERLTLTAGGRFQLSDVNANEVDPDPSDATIIDDIQETYVVTAGNLRALYEVAPEWIVYAAAGQAFRAPNLSDLTRFDNARTNEVEIPAPGLHPEKYLTLEAGTKVRTRRLELSCAYYYTFIDDQIVRFPTGATDPSGGLIVTKDNVGDGHAEGVELLATAPLTAGWELYGGFNWFYGVADTLLSPGVRTRAPLSRSAPATGVCGARYRIPETKAVVEFDVRVAERADRLSPDDERDTQRIPPGGTPGYAVWGIRGEWELVRNVAIFAAAENITDRDYRIHGSGTNEPGVNVVVGTEISF